MTPVDDVLSTLDRDALRELVRHALHHAGSLPPGEALPPGVVKGTVALTPREDGLAAKDVPVETLLHKITGIRDKLRVTEQRINASDAVDAPHKHALQARLTEAYRALAAVDALLTPPHEGETP